MIYFITEVERKKGHGTCFFEFQKGLHYDKFWNDDSLCLHADFFDEMNLNDLFKTAIPMISKTELQLIDTQYFNILQMGCFTIYVQSKNTKHFWGIHVAEYPTFRNFKVSQA